MERSKLRLSITALVTMWLGLLGQTYAAPFAYITANGGTVSVIDTATRSVIDSISVSNLTTWVSIDPSGDTVYISNHGPYTISVIDAINNNLKEVIDIGSTAPYGTIVHPDGTKLYAATAFNNEVIVIDTGTNNIIDSIPVGDLPIAVDILPDGSALYVTNALSDTVSVVDTGSNIVNKIIDSFYSVDRGIGVHPGGGSVYVVDADEIAVIDAGTNEVVKRISLGLYADDLTVHPDGETLYVAASSYDTVLVIDISANIVTDTLTVGDEPLGIDVHPDGETVYVVSQGDDTVYVLDSATNTVVSAIPVGYAPIGFGDFIGPLPDNVGGSVTGVIAKRVVCRNRTTRKTVVIPLGVDEESWDCEAAGLEVHSGDRILQTVTGTAK